jgi:hypothetical protein
MSYWRRIIAPTQDGRSRGVHIVFCRERGAACQHGEKPVEDRDDLDGTTQTTSAGLIRLTSVIAALTRERAIDTRFGAKLLRRIDKEAHRVARGAAALDEAEQTALFGALGELDVALRRRDAASLVEANARLRATESAAGKKRKSKKDEKDDTPAENDDA